MPTFQKEYVYTCWKSWNILYKVKYVLTYISSRYCGGLQVGKHTWKVSPHLWRSSLLVTNDSSDCSTSGVGFRVVLEICVGSDQTVKPFWDISEEMGANLKWNLFITTVWKVLDAPWLWVCASSCVFCHFTVYILLNNVIYFMNKIYKNQAFFSSPY